MSYYSLIVRRECDYCEKAVEMLEDAGVEYITTDMTKHPELLAETKKVLEWETTPIILAVHSPQEPPTIIGGSTELEEYLTLEQAQTEVQDELDEAQAEVEEEFTAPEPELETDDGEDDDAESDFEPLP